jgi:hypothetical protein
LINAADDCFAPPMIIIQEQKIMISWFSSKDLSSDTLIVPSDNDFTTDKIAVKFLKHYIKNSDAWSDSTWKLLLMNSHDSHITPEFVSLTNEIIFDRFHSFHTWLTVCNHWM